MFEITASKARALALMVDKDAIAAEIEYYIRRSAEKGERELEYFTESFREVGRPHLKGIHQSILAIRDELQNCGFRVYLRLNEEDQKNIYVEAIEVGW